MKMKRSELKTFLWQERTDWGIGRPRCEVCGKPLGNACDMHEAVIPKRTAMGWHKKHRRLINHQYNCVLTCSGTGCHLWAHAHPDVMIAQLIVRYGWETLDGWVKSLPFKVPFAWHRGVLSEAEAAEIVAAVTL